MTLPFNEEIINDGDITPDSFKYPDFVGYLNPTGIPIDYSMPYGLGGHDKNPTTELFKRYFYIRYKEYNMDGLILYGETEKGDNNERNMGKIHLERLRENLNSLNDSFSWYREKGLAISKFDIMDRDLLEFFKNCYESDTFNKGLGKHIRLMCSYQFSERDFAPIYAECLKLYPKKENETPEQYKRRTPFYYHQDFQYRDYLENQLLDLLKETLISYLGYHSVERIPRTITTSEFKIYETFYNYLLNDFNVFQIPKMIYDPDKKIYVEQKQNQFFVPDSEIKLKEEIQSIKKLVPRNERYKYYR